MLSRDRRGRKRSKPGGNSIQKHIQPKAECMALQRYEYFPYTAVIPTYWNTSHVRGIRRIFTFPKPVESNHFMNQWVIQRRMGRTSAARRQFLGITWRSIELVEWYAWYDWKRASILSAQPPSLREKGIEANSNSWSVFYVVENEIYVIPDTRHAGKTIHSVGGRKPSLCCPPPI